MGISLRILWYLGPAQPELHLGMTLGYVTCDLMPSRKKRQPRSWRLRSSFLMSMILKLAQKAEPESLPLASRVNKS